MTKFFSRLLPGCLVDRVSGGNSPSMRLYDLLDDKTSASGGGMHHYNTSHFMQHHIRPVPGREQNRAVSAIAAPGSIWVPWLRTDSVIPWSVGQAVYLSNREEGWNIVLGILLHCLCKM